MTATPVRKDIDNLISRADEAGQRVTDALQKLKEVLENKDSQVNKPTEKPDEKKPTNGNGHHSDKDEQR